MTPYLIKSILEILALLIIYIIAVKHDERITILEDADKFRKVIKENSKEKEPSFKQKVAVEKKRISKIKK